MSNSFKSVIGLILAFVSLSAFAVDTLDVSLERGQLLLTERHGGDGSAWGNENCSACHFSRSIHRDAPAIRGIVRDVGFDSCTGCHGQNGTDAIRRCTICHNADRLPRSPIQEGIETHDFSVDEQHVLADEQCLICHQSSDMDGTFEADIDLTRYQNQFNRFSVPYRNGVEFCLSCHNREDQIPGFEMQPRFLRDPLVTINDSYRHIDFHGFVRGSGDRIYAGLRAGSYQYGDLVECTDCHAMHGTHNKKLIVDRTDAGMVGLDPAIRNQPVFINVERGDYSQLCVTCHSMNVIVEFGADDTGNGLSGVHEVGIDCRICHVHGLAVQTGL